MNTFRNLNDYFFQQQIINNRDKDNNVSKIA